MDGDRDYLERLAALNGRPLEHVPPADPSADIERVRRQLQRDARRPAPEAAGALHFRRDLPTASTRTPVRPPRTLDGAAVPLDALAPGVERDVPPWGRALELALPAADVCSYGAGVSETYDRRCCAGSAVCERIAALAGSADAGRHDVLFMDLETAGLSNAPVFLVGLMALEDGRLVVRQYLARTYAEEAAITALFVEALAGYRVLVTFNGKTFDLPYMRVRAAATGVPFRAAVGHLDLLHESRRAWARTVPNHRLQTLERWICGRERQDDLPGAEVPEVYHAFVRSGDAREMARVLEHNRRDLLTLAELLCYIPESHWRPEPAPE